MNRFSTVQLATGPRIHYASQGDDDGEPVVLLHGWPDSWFSYSRVLPLLPRTSSCRGPGSARFGDSDRPAGEYGIEQFAADAIALLDALSIERATFVGHSFGTFVTRCAAITSPTRVARIILIGTGVAGGNSVTREVQTSLRNLKDPVPLEFAREFQSSTAFVPLPEAFFDRILTESLKLPAGLWRQVLDGIVAYDDAEQVAKIAVPTLLLWGEHDAIFPREDQDRLVAAIPGARLKVYPETGHCPNWERPELVAGDIKAFMEGRSRGARYVARLGL